jgi:DNA-binding MarR family transcriptional regulator
MGVIKKVLLVPREKYFIQHLSIINSMLPVTLTPKEIEVLGSFMSLTGDIAEQDRFGTTSRKIVKERLNLSDGGIGNYIKSLKEKGFIYTGEDGNLRVQEVLEADKNNQSYLFKIVEDGNS